MRSSRSMHKLAPVVALAVGASLGLTACGGGTAKPADPAKEDTGSKDSSSSEPAAAGADTITAAIGYDGDNYDPATTTSAISLSANWHTMEGLTELDPVTREAYPALAKEMPKKVDDTTYEATLRDDAKFSDGTEVTADDIIKAFERTMDGFYKPMLSFLDSVDKKDDKTVVIKTKYPFSLVNERLSLVKIVPASQSEEDLKSKPIGTGPYKMTSAIKSKAVDFEQNEHYNGSRPAKTPKMHWDILVDATARVTAMSQGTVMAIDNVPAVNKATLEGKAKMEAVQGFGLDFLMFNTKKAPFDNAKVRQAFLYAIDAEGLVEKVWQGNATPATSFLQKEHPNYHEASVVYKHDVEKAKKLLEEAGVSDLKITLNTTDHPWITQDAALIQQNLKEAGIEAQIQTDASSAMYSNVTDVDNPQFDVVLAPGDPSVFGNDPDLLMSWWYGDNSWTEKRSQWKGSDGYNKLHELMDKAARSTGQEQQDAWNECFDLLSEEVPIYPLYHKKVTTAWDENKLDGFKPIALTGLDFLDVSAK